MTDIQIAQAAKMMRIEELADDIGLKPESLSPYGRYIAKVDPRYYRDLPRRAKLVLVTAITPTPAGEGKTTVSISLAVSSRRAAILSSNMLYPSKRYSTTGFFCP